jgi:hypothetical protein
MRAALLGLLCGALTFAGEPVTIGQKLDSIQVRDVGGATASFNLQSRVSVVVFYSTQCPISNEYSDRMNALYKQYSSKGVQLVFVNANQNESAGEMISHSKSAEFVFPVYKDTGNVLADRLGATVTPEAYVFDASGTLRYHGHIDDARNPARAQVHGLRNALDQVLAGQPVTKAESKAFGCTIKRVRKAS